MDTGSSKLVPLIYTVFLCPLIGTFCCYFDRMLGCVTCLYGAGVELVVAVAGDERHDEDGDGREDDGKHEVDLLIDGLHGRLLQGRI